MGQACSFDKESRSAIHSDSISQLVRMLIVKHVSIVQHLMWDGDAKPRKLRWYINWQISGDGNTALHLCAVYGTDIHRQLAKVLVEGARANLLIKNKKGDTPHETAIKRGNDEIASYLWSHFSLEQRAMFIHNPTM